MTISGYLRIMANCCDNSSNSAEFWKSSAIIDEFADKDANITFEMVCGISEFRRKVFTHLKSKEEHTEES